MVLSLLAPLAPAAADYSQYSVNAARTGVTSEVGPERDDIAFSLELPGTLTGHPLIIDGAVYAAVRALDDMEIFDTTGIMRIDLDTAETEVVVELEQPARRIASDGSWLFVVRSMGVDAYTIGDGEPVWSWEHERLTALPNHGASCANPAITADAIFLLCEEIASDAGTPFFLGTPEPIPDQAHPGGSAEAVPFVAALDKATGSLLWTWSDPVVEGPLADLHMPRVAAPLPVGALGGVAVVDDHVVVSYQQPGLGGYGEAYIRAFPLDSNSIAWEEAISLGDQAAEASETQDPGFVEGTRQMRILGAPAGDETEAYYVIHDLVAVNPSSGDEAWRHPLNQVDDDLVGGNAFVLSGNDLFVASRGVLFKFDRAGQSPVWEQAIGTSEHFDSAAMVLAGGTLYARTHRLFDFEGPIALEDPQNDPEINPEYFYAYDPQNGNIRWKHKVYQDEDRYYWNGGSQYLMALSDGVMAIQGIDGTLRVLGTTAASLGPVAEASNLYPALREEVQVDLSSTEPGVHGNATEYRAAWGDGAVMEWQSSPVMSHSYTQPEMHLAEFSVRNEAGQTATIPLTFDVEGERPVEPNWIAVFFEPDNQDMTFGVLGILVALLVAMAGVTHQRRKRGRLQKEIDAADAVYRESRHDPMVSLRALKERKALAQGLAVDGKLDEAQFGLLRDHIDGLSRRLRVPLVEEEFGFLPAPMLTSLRSMMEDGKITRYERDTFLERLNKQRRLDMDQKDRVRKRLDAWFGEDAGGDGVVE